MSMRTVELVSEWESVPFDGGYDGLHSLSDQGFSGAVTAGPTQLFMLNGTVVGILDGDIEDFDGTDGTARAAPHDALPLLVVMQDRADGPRAQYYTEDTAISEVDRTLEDGNFTGFVELSENVLSGDYYLVYHQGRSMSVAWVGNSQRLITDEEAFEQADGEVGIYQVMPADIEPVEIPEPEPSSAAEDSAVETGAGTAAAPNDGGADEWDTPAAGGAGGAESDGPADAATVQESPASEADEGRSAAGETADTAPASATDTTERERGSAGPPGSKAAGASQGTAVDRTRQEAGDTAEAGSTADPPAGEPATETVETAEADETETASPTADESVSADAETTAPAEPTGQAEPATEPEPSTGHTSGAEATDRSEEPSAPAGARESQTAAAATDSDAVGALETRSIPSLDPERSSSTPEETGQSASASTGTQSASTSTQQGAGAGESGSTESTPAKSQSKSTDSQPAQSKSTATKSQSTQTSETRQPEPSAELEAKLAERESEISELEGEIRELSAENEELAAERDRLVGELEEARAEIQRLEEELAAAGGAAPSGETLSPAAAIDGTNLFIRYHSKGEATLESARNGGADRAAVDENLRLEHHTQFDAADTVVDGESFEAFLQDSIQYRFVDWLVRNLLYEVRDTGHESAMGVLYEALPKVDRAELNGKVSVTYTENGEDHRSQETFDVVVRDRMGNPLVVANINDSRQPATEGQMTDILQNAERVGNASDSLAAAFLVTSSFFEPEALETAREATSSGLFSRDKRKSFVNLSRKGGYHLCLLEARNREFHLAVPEL